MPEAISKSNKKPGDCFAASSLRSELRLAMTAEDNYVQAEPGDCWFFKDIMSVSGNSARILLRVHPNAARNEVVGFTDGVLGVRVAAPPVKGKANQELIAYLSKLLSVSKGSIAIIKGHTSRFKVVAIDGLDQEEAIKRLS